jgi:hypothetical protein
LYEQDSYGYFWGFTGIYGTVTRIFGTLAKHIAPVDEVPFLFGITK